MGHDAEPVGATTPHLVTPDGRYLVVRGRLWRRTRPDLSEARRSELARDLMAARRAVRAAADPDAKRLAPEWVDRTKRALGERGPVWWTDGAPDFNRRLARNTPYRDWFAAEAGAVGAREPAPKPSRYRASPTREAPP